MTFKEAISIMNRYDDEGQEIVWLMVDDMVKFGIAEPVAFVVAINAIHKNGPPPGLD